MLSSFLAWIVHTDYTFINVLTWINHILGIIMLVLYANLFILYYLYLLNHVDIKLQKQNIPMGILFVEETKKKLLVI